MLNQPPGHKLRWWVRAGNLGAGYAALPPGSVGQIQFASEEWPRESAIGGDSAIGGVRWPADKLI